MAKSPFREMSGDQETEIRKKIALGYPTKNIIFEDTCRAVLVQERVFICCSSAVARRSPMLRGCQTASTLVVA